MTNKYLQYIHSEKWRQKSRAFRSVMLNRCCVLPFLKSNDAHHMTYANLENEIFLRDVVPLSKSVHGFVHAIARLVFLKHDNHVIRFFINWLLLRPSCFFWLIVLTLFNFLSKGTGRKAVANVCFLFSGISVFLAAESIKYRLFYGFLCFVFSSLYFVFEEK